ncbi:MAG: sulfatase-like hydrolase/transferase [Myxococcota bacterium]
MTLRASGGSALAALHVAVLAAFAVSQPLFELMARHVEFLVAHQVDGADIAWIALGLGLGLPGGFGLAAWIGAKLPGRGSRAVLWCFVAGLIAAIALPGFEAIGDAVQPAFGAAAAVGIVGATAYLRTAAVRAFATLLTPALLLFPALFVWNVADIASEADRFWPSIAARSGQPQSDAPVVVVVFDALPLNSLLGDDGSIDAARYPHFAALAARAHWYFHATTVAERTTYALPAILTGQYPDQIRAATAAEYPQNLFTVLSTGRSLNVIEPFTRLCPRALCGSVESRRERLESIASDLVVLYLNRLLPDAASELLPDVTTSWKNFASERPSDGIRRRRADASWIFDRFLEGIVGSDSPESARDPALHFIHINLPHRPYRYLPSGTEYGPIGSFGVAHGARKGVWQDDEWEVAQALQRHLLQLRYADSLLGRLMQRLEQVGSFDEALIVVTADHGISFRAGGGMRQVDRKDPLRNAGDILRVPLLVKLPGQTAPVRSDRNVETIDILPTIVDALGGRLPEPVDGVSALQQSESATTRTSKVVYVRDGTTRAALPVAATLPLGDSVWRRLGISESADLFAMGPHSELHGRSSGSLAMLVRSGLELRLIDASAYEAVDPGSPFVPAHVTGEILFAGEPEQRDLAVAINGVIRATTRTYGARSGRARFTAMVAPDAFRAGANVVEIFVIRERAGRIALEPTERLPDVSYFGVPGANGRIGAIGSSDGRIYPLVPRAVAGQVTHSGAYFEGEAVDARRDRAAESLLVFAEGQLLHVQPLAPAQRDGEAPTGRSHEPSFLSPRHRRFRFAIPFGKLGGDESAHVQFVGLARDAASRIRYRSADRRSTETSWLGPTGTLALVSRGERDGLAIGETWVPIDPRGVRGAVEAGGDEPATLSGWVTEHQRPPAAVLVFVDGQFTVAVPIDPARSRFELELPDHDPNAIRFIVTSADGTASELEYSPSP